MNENERAMELLKEHMDTMSMIENNAKKIGSETNIELIKDIAKEQLKLIDYIVILSNELLTYSLGIDWDLINETYDNLKKLRDVYSLLID